MFNVSRSFMREMKAARIWSNWLKIRAASVGGEKPWKEFNDKNN